jgi:ABC-type Fe3+-hydroxamate transport system substrate-binding protein
MRRTLTVCRAGLSAAAVVVLLSACGGSGDHTSASSSSSARTSDSKTSAAAQGGSEFCTKAATVESTIASALANQSDVAAVSQALQTAVAQIRDIDPPEEIATDWTALAGGIEQIAGAFGSIDASNPSAVATFQQQAAQLEGQLSAPAANVQNYLAKNCGLGTPTSTSAPTS